MKSRSHICSPANTPDFSPDRRNPPSGSCALTYPNFISIVETSQTGIPVSGSTVRERDFIRIMFTALRQKRLREGGGNGNMLNHEKDQASFGI